MAMCHKSGCLSGKISDLAGRGLKSDQSIKKIIKKIIKYLRKLKKLVEFDLSIHCKTQKDLRMQIFSHFRPFYVDFVAKLC